MALKLPAWPFGVPVASYLFLLKITPPVRRKSGPSGWKSSSAFRLESLMSPV